MKIATEEKERQSFVKSLLTVDYELHVKTIEAAGRAQNNFVYRVELSSPAVARSNAFTQKPGVSVFPENTTRLCLRISNDDVSLEESVRVPNEVAFMTLTRDALSSLPTRIVPLCFGWADKASGRGWILREWIEGEALDMDGLRKLGKTGERAYFRQIAQVVKLLQDYKLPTTIKGYGGVVFDNDGNMVSSKMSLPCGGPFSTYKALLKGMCQWQLNAADRSQIIGGWKESKLRERMDQFLTHGLDELLKDIPEDQPTLIHADIGSLNIMVNPSTSRITALIDFDFSHIGSPISEFVLSFLIGFDYCLLGSADALEIPKLREYMLRGFPEQLSYEEGRMAKSKVLDEALKQVGAKRPSTIQGADVYSDVLWFSQDICQAYWLMPKFLEKRTKKQLSELKKSGEENLELYLSSWGY